MRSQIVFIVFATFCYFPLLAFAQSDFNPESFIQFLEDNKDMESEELLARYAAQSPYYKQIDGGSSIEKFSYLDSIIIKYGLTESELDLLKQNHFVVSERMLLDGNERHYRNCFVWAFDDIFVKELPVFITTDAILHALHISYVNLLIQVERQVLKPEIERMVNVLSENYPILLNKYQSNSQLHSALEDVDLYLTIAKSLLLGIKLTPQYTSSSSVSDIWDAINSEQFVYMPLFTEINRPLDFSQFTVRGHYADEPELSPYFRCMMWLGRMDFILANAPWEWYEQLGFTKDGLLRMNLGALLLNELIEISGTRSVLNEIDEIIEFMVGESDNLTPAELADLVITQGITGADVLLDGTTFGAFQNALTTSSNYGQKILSSFVKGTLWTTEPTPLPVSFRLMGQRFIIDSYIFYKVVYDNVVYQDEKVCRMMPDPLDALFALGNDDALPILEGELERWKYGLQLAALRYLIDAYDADFWTTSLYNVWLQSIRLLNPNGTQAGLPLFMQTVAWHQEKLNTQLASWTQLRHDNLLYAKQSWTHGGDCIFPHSYVEPYPAFYRQIAAFAEKAESFAIFKEFRQWDKGGSIADYFQRVKEIMIKLETIAHKELNREILTDEETFFLQQMLFLERSSGIGADGWYIDLFYSADGLDEDYIIADVHTQPTDCAGNIVGRILHAGVGKINLGVFLADSPSDDFRPMAYVGPVMSYYEKITEDFDRLTDERWAESVKSEDLPARPDWVNIYLGDKHGNAMEPGRELPGVVYTQIAENSESAPEMFRLFQNYPNPFNPSTKIKFTLPKSENVTIEVYNIIGQKIETLLNKPMPAGYHEVTFNGQNLSSGVYLYKIEVADPARRTGKWQDVKKMILLR